MVTKKTSTTSKKDKIDLSSGYYWKTIAQKQRLTATLLIIKMAFEREVFDRQAREGEEWVKSAAKKYFIVPKAWLKAFESDLFMFCNGEYSEIGNSVSIYG